MTLLERIGIFVSIGVILVLLLLIVFSDHGLLDYKKLKEKQDQIVLDARRLEKENKKLELEINRLKTDLEYIKHIAKHEHDMVEKDELIFKDKPDKQGAKP